MRALSLVVLPDHATWDLLPYLHKTLWAVIGRSWAR